MSRGSAIGGVLAVAALALPSSAAAAPPDTIRTGGPSAPGDAKVAIVASSDNLNGDRFTVQRVGGGTALSGRLTRAAGSARPWRFAFAADLSAVTAPGSYIVRVGRVRSRPWVVADGAHRGPIRTLLRFFAAQNDGNEPSPLHGPSHLNDAVIAGGPYNGQRFDLTGGWMDAGNQVKLVTTTGFSVIFLEAAARLDPALAPELLATSDVGVRWLLRAHPRPDLFVVQIGDQRDSDRGFADPAADDRSTAPGIGVRAAYPQAGGDQAGMAAAALAYAALRSAPEVSALLIQAAREWYAFGEANIRPGGGSPLDDFYESQTSEDNLAVGAAALFRATGDPLFLADAIDYLRGQELGELNWNNTGAFAAADMCGAIGLPPVEDAAIRAEACTALRTGAAAVTAFARRNAFGTPGPPAFGQTAENGGGGVLTALAGRLGLQPDGLRIAAGARDYVLGRNQWGASFVVGLGPRSPRHPHHWAEFVRPRRTLTGAVVGGPTTTAILREQRLTLGRSVFRQFNSRGFVYEDQRDNYVTSEPAIDYAIANLLLLAALAGG